MLKSGGVLNLIAALLVMLVVNTGPARAQATGTHSPHGNLNVPCQNCHTANAWRPIRAVPEFDHSQTRYPLWGMHQSVTCTQCHVKPVFTNVGQRCQDCHADIHRRQLGANCEQCHTVRGWQVSIQQVQEHNNRFPLTGAHAAVDCDSCHKGAANSKFTTMSTQCYSCHQSEFQRTTNPNHVTAMFPTTCDSCHTTDNWLNAKFDHAAVGFPLTNAHAVPPRQCADCHTNNNYGLSSVACVTCHLKDYQGTTNPSHVTGKFPQACGSCHSTSTWLNATFNHNSTGFPLTGNHTVPPRQCSDCHVNNNYNITTTACVSCHQKDYNGATTPVNHIAAGFPTTCETCHDAVLWTDGKFNHASTGFPLTGAHTVPPRLCADCHVNNNYALNSVLCYSCHQKDYAATNNPAHAAAGFPTTCEVCHDTSVWTDSRFNHNNTAFPLTGSHTVPPRQCSDCHVNNNYTTLPTTCIGCHKTDYNNTTNPGHSAQPQFFPTTCQTCHNTTAWTGATFNHTQYTQFSTNHGGAGNVCSTCHINSNNYAVFQCTGCHGGNNPNNFQHDKVPGYVYNSINCYQCHSTG
jgi:hypothetical protein